MAVVSSFRSLLDLCFVGLTAFLLELVSSLLWFRLLGCLRLSNGGYPGGTLETEPGSLSRGKRRLEIAGVVIRL